MKIKIILDVGVELDEGSVHNIPQIEGLFYGVPQYNAVFLSHYHADHIGLASNILNGIPIYMGERAFEIMRASNQYRNIQTNFLPKFMENGKQITIGNIKIIPISCDHSAFDSYMLLIESDGKKVLYTGDFRANGRGEFKDILADLPTVDAIIIEGTVLSRDYTGRNIEEEKLEEIGVDAIKDSIAKKRFLMTVRPSMSNYLEKLSKKISFEGGILFYALWKGYQKQPYVKNFLDFMQNKGVKTQILHTSGHADSQTIDDLIFKISPKTIIPVHTENADYFKKFSYKSNVVLDSREVEV